VGLYDDILATARNYMGPAAEDYINRRIRIVQRGDEPEQIGADKLDRLAAGIDMTAKVYMGPAKAAAFRDAILALKARYERTPSQGSGAWGPPPGGR
jgi:hypothetical protein